jgi:hypothetical protein
MRWGPGITPLTRGCPPRLSRDRAFEKTIALLGTAAAIQEIEVASVLNAGRSINWFETGLNFIFPTTDGWVLALGFFKENPLGLMC